MSRTREDFLDVFVKAVNICTPEHPYWDTDEAYPITADQVKYSYCTKSGPYWARCGPRRRYSGNVALYAIDTSYYQSISPERVLAVTTHELTHITHGSHEGRYATSHPKKFWQEMAFNAQQIRDNLNQFTEVLGEIDTDAYVTEVIQDPNSFTVDKRIHTAEECQEMVSELLGVDYTTID